MLSLRVRLIASAADSNLVFFNEPSNSEDEASAG